MTLYIDDIFSNRYQKVNPQHQEYITLGIGGNVGNTKRIFQKLISHLKSNKKINLISISPILQNPPFGYINQDDFYNCIIIIKSSLSVNELFKLTSRLENRFGRIRTFQDAPRTLDIDIIFFKQKKINTKKLTIPHKDWHNRDSVTIPLQINHL